MAEIQVTLEVRGESSIVLPVQFQVATPVSVGSVPVEVEFTITNPLDRSLTFPSLQVSKGGTGADKLNVSLLATSMVFGPSTTQTNKLILSPDQPLIEGETVSISVVGVEG